MYVSGKNRRDTLEAWFREPEVSQQVVKSGHHCNILSSVEDIQAKFLNTVSRASECKSTS
jgi:hypothetical protein